MGFYILFTPCQAENLFKESLHLFHLVVATHEDARTVVDVFRVNFKHPLHVVVNCLAAGYRGGRVSRAKTAGAVGLPFSKTMAMGAHS